MATEANNCQVDIDKVLSDPPLLVESFSDSEIDSDTTNICVQNVVSYSIWLGICYGEYSSLLKPANQNLL